MKPIARQGDLHRFPYAVTASRHKEMMAMEKRSSPENQVSKPLYKQMLAGMILLCWLIFQEAAMAQTINRQYWVNVHTEGAAWTLRINDLKVITHSTTEQYSMSYPISVSLKEGLNTVSLIFAPLEEDAQGYLVQDPSTGEYLQGPKENFWVDVSIDAIDTRTQAKERIETLQLRYDMETGELVDYPETPVNPDGERTHQTEHLRTRGEFQVNSPDRLVVGNGESIGAERVDMDFRVLDPIPDFHWAEEATPLEDTPLLRHELRQAYQRLHRLYERGDTEAILREGKAVWDRTGLLMAGGKNAREYTESLPIASQIAGLRHEPDGPRLEPLRLADDPAEDTLEFMGNGRLVRIVPSPLTWSFPNDPERTWQVPFVFYCTSAGEWRIATVAS